MNEKWLEVSDRDRQSAECVRLRGLRERARIPHLLNEHQRIMGHDMQSLDDQVFEAVMQRAAEAARRVDEGLEMQSSVRSYISDVQSAHEKTLSFEREYASYLDGQIKEFKDKWGKKQEEAAPLMGDDPNEIAAQHTRHMACVQAQWLLEQMNEVKPAAPSEPVVRDKAYYDHRERVLNSRRLMQKAINEENLRSARVRQESRSRDRTSLPDSNFHSLQMDFKGLSREEVHKILAANAALIRDKEREFIEVVSPGLSLPSFKDDKDEWRKREKERCDMENRTRELRTTQPGDEQDSFNGNSLT